MTTPRVLETVPAVPDSGVVLDVAVAVVGTSVGVGMAVLRGVAGSPVLRSRAVWRPALLPTRLQPATVVTELARRGARQREVAVRQAQALADQWAPLIAEAVLSRMDLTDVVLRNLDVDRVVAAVDLEAAISRVDLVALVEEVIAAVDLPAIIRDSTGSMASETVRGARMTGITVDDAITQALERRLFRRRRAAAAPTEGGPV